MAALVWQRRFNEFDGSEVITDLAQQPHLMVHLFKDYAPEYRAFVAMRAPRPNSVGG